MFSPEPKIITKKHVGDVTVALVFDPIDEEYRYEIDCSLLGGDTHSVSPAAAKRLGVWLDKSYEHLDDIQP